MIGIQLYLLVYKNKAVPHWYAFLVIVIIIIIIVIIIIITIIILFRCKGACY